MIEVAEAIARVLEMARPLPRATVDVTEALDLTLADEVTSDVDSPPHDKSIVDGYAVLSSDLASGAASLNVLEEVVAGGVPTLPLVSGYATRIMTGAPAPAGADAIVMVEFTTRQPSETGREQVRIESRATPGQNILRRGVSLRMGDVVLKAGRQLRAAEIGLLCEVGQAKVRVVPRPTVAVLPTGDELVAPSEKPGPGQIRNSNGPMLLAAVRRAGAEPRDLGVGRDDRSHLAERIREGLKADVLVLSGGVSAGVLDLAPAVLAELGVKKVFHKVRLKPGKPLWFGVLPAEPSPKLVFGLPGNPVSSLVCFELFVRPALACLAGRPTPPMANRSARLTRDFEHRGDRPTFYPAVWRDGPEPRIEPLAWQGSADLRGLVAANSLIHFPAGDRRWREGETVALHPLD